MLRTDLTARYAAGETLQHLAADMVTLELDEQKGAYPFDREAWAWNRRYDGPKQCSADEWEAALRGALAAWKD